LPCWQFQCWTRSLSWRRTTKQLGLAVLASHLGLMGCGSGVKALGNAAGSAIAGSVFAANQPVGGASVQIYTADSSEKTGIVALLPQPARTKADGTFAIPQGFACPSSASQVYAVVHSGASSQSSQAQSALVLVAAIGDCVSTQSQSTMHIDEFSTVAAAYALSPLMQSFESMGSTVPTDEKQQDAFAFAASLEQVLRAAALDPSTPISQADSTEKMMTLAGTASVCLGGTSDACSRLFADTMPLTGEAPSDTASALFQIAKYPNYNVAAIYGLKPSSASFQPMLIQAPANWALSFDAAPAAPTISPASGTFTGPQTVTLSSATPNASLFYNLGSGWTPYKAPITVSTSATVSAIAVGSTASKEASQQYTIAAGTIAVHAPQILSVGQDMTGTVTLSAPAPSTSVMVTIVSASPTIASASQTVVIPAAQTSASFVLKALKSGNTTVTATAPAFGSAVAMVVVESAAVAVNPASVSLTASQTQQFTASVTGNTSNAVSWTMSPVVGILSSTGLYKAPGTIDAAQTVTLTATSTVDPTKSASAVVLLKPAVAVSASPLSVNLAASQTQQFAATVTGSTNPAVSWTMSPAVGTLSNTGLYAAPATISAAQTVMLTATSTADSTKSSSVVVSLKPTVAVSASPADVSLMASQVHQFTASVTGSTNTAVSWTMSPAAGTLSNTGLYTAPATISATQTVTLTATSTADPTKRSSVVVSLKPTVAISASPANVTLTALQTQLFTAAVTGSSSAAVSWTMSPAVGTLSGTGLYMAPASINAAQIVTLTATSSVDPTKSSSVTLRLVPTLTLTLSVPSATVPSGSQLSGAVTLSGPSAVDTVVALSSSAPASLIITPATQVIPAGQTTATFRYSGVAQGNAVITMLATGYASATANVATIAAAVPAEFFGMSVQDFTHLMPTLSYATARSWDAYPNIAWTDVNTAPGQFNFSGLDTFMQYNQSRDMIYTFGRTPQWASSLPNQPGTYGPGQCAPPADLAVWDQYVTAIVTHAAGRIKYWELWNEPNSPAFYCGDMPTLVTMASRAYAIIKSIDPTATVLSPAMEGTAGSTWMGYYLYLGGAKYADVIAFHGYSTRVAEDINTTIAQYRFVMAANGAAGKPLWDTEASWAGEGNLGTPSLQQQVGYIAKSYALHLSLGVSRFVWYAYDGGSTWGGLLDSSFQPTAAATAYSETRKWLLGASLTTACSPNLLGTWSCGLTRSGGYSAQMIWNSVLSQTVTVPDSFVDYRDLAGNTHTIMNHTVTVGDQPILLETAPLPQ
jgi:hypothetical protein